MDRSKFFEDKDEILQKSQYAVIKGCNNADITMIDKEYWLCYQR